MTNNFAELLDEPAAVLWNLSASALALNAALGATRSVIAAIDEADAIWPERSSQVLMSLTPAPGSVRRLTIATIFAHLEALDREAKQRVLWREMTVSLAERLAARLGAAEAAEKVRDEAREPMREQTERVDNLAKRFSEFQALAERIVYLLRVDVRAAKLGGNLLTMAHRAAVPRNTRSVAIDIKLTAPNVLAVDEILQGLKLPGHWPPIGGPEGFLNRPYYFAIDDEQNEILGPLRELMGKKVSTMEAERAIARAQAVLLAEYSKAAAKIDPLVCLDATITAEDCQLKYPDGGRVFDQAKFPPDWRIGRMRQRIQVPSINAAMAAAAE